MWKLTPFSNNPFIDALVQVNETKELTVCLQFKVEKTITKKLVNIVYIDIQLRIQ